METDFLIIGAGFAGLATAYHLKRSTPQRIVIVEQEEAVGVHSSGRNAAIIRQHADEPQLQAVLSAGAEKLRDGQLAAYNRCGVMIVGAGSTRASDVFARTRGHGRWCPEDGTVDVHGLLSAYLAGQEVRYSTRVESWERIRGRILVHTNRGDLVAKIVINAAGPWAGELGRLPLTPMNRHLFVSEVLDWVDQGWPCIWDGDHKFYFRPESGGLMLCCCDESAADPGDYSENPDVLEELARKIQTLQPGLGQLAVRTSWVGQRTFAPDRCFVIGFDPRDDSVFHVAALGGHGVTASYTIGQMAAALITGQRPGSDNPFSPQRLLD